MGRNRRAACGGLIAVLTLLGGLVSLAAPCAEAQAGAPAKALAPGEAQLDAMLATGRTKPGLRSDSQALRAWLGGEVGNPFIPMLQELGQLGAGTFESDSVAVVVARFKRFTDSTWAPLATYLATLPDSYSVDVAWARVLGASDSVTRRMLANGAGVAGLLTAGQLAQFPPNLKSFLYPACGSWFRERVVNGLQSVPSVLPSRVNALPVCPEVK